MPTPKEQARATLVRLVEKFDKNYLHYKSPAYSEAQLRIDFLNPWLEAFGWDVPNHENRPLSQREVITEDRVRVAGRQKAPDYGVQLDGRFRFYIEAKKPSVNLHDDPAPAVQVRTYAWNKTLPLSFLTDFEELALYDCRANPNARATAATARLEYLRYDTYLTHFDQLWDMLAREAVADGSLDRRAAAVPEKKGTQTVDVAFLNTLEQMRLDLAQGLIQQNPGLDVDGLRYLVQMLLDRIVFLRIAEDREVEPYGDLERLAADRKKEKPGQLYAGLLDRFRAAVARYNSGLFDLDADTLSTRVTLTNDVVRELLRGLYFPQSNYKFDVIGVDILGSAYERFLGKVIQIPAPGQARIVEKPEVRKAGGVYYTPPYIVRYIVQATLGPLCQGRTPAEVAQLRIVDPACGSGSFLLGAYDYLLDWHQDYYQRHPKAAAPPTAAPKPKAGKVAAKGGTGPALTADGQLSTTTRKAILLNNLYGVDLDAQAVEVTKLSLLLKCLEGETRNSAAQQLGVERLLPTIDQNVKVGNSLVDPSVFDYVLFSDEARRELNPFEWKDEFPEVFARRKGFDAMIGNPPYIRIQVLRESSPLQADFISRNYQTAREGNFDIYVAFIERGLQLLNPTGRLGFILPHKFFTAKYGQATRELLAAKRAVERVVHFGDQQVFAGISTYTCLLFLTPEPRELLEVEAVAKLIDWDPAAPGTWVAVPYSRLDGSEWYFADNAGAELLARLRQTGYTLADATTRIFQGLKTSADKVYIVEELERQPGRVRVKCRQDEQEYWVEPGLLHPLIKGGDSRRFRLTQTKRLILFPYAPQGDEKKMGLLPESDLKKQFPLTHAYLSAHKRFLKDREKGKMDGPKWYAYIYPKALDVMGSVKLFTPDIAARSAFSLDAKGDVFFTGGAAGGYGLLPAKGVTLKYLMGVLNSRVFEWMVRQTSTSMRGGFFSYESRFIAPLPLPKLNPKSADHKQAVADITKEVDELTTLHQQRAAATVPTQQQQLQRQLTQAELRLDRLVYRLYDLSLADIAQVEAALG